MARDDRTGGRVRERCSCCEPSGLVPTTAALIYELGELELKNRNLRRVRVLAALRGLELRQRTGKPLAELSRLSRRGRNRPAARATVDAADHRVHGLRRLGLLREHGDHDKHATGRLEAAPTGARRRAWIWYPIGTVGARAGQLNPREPADLQGIPMGWRLATVMRRVGFEPTRPVGQGLLRASRLPFRHRRAFGPPRRAYPGAPRTPAAGGRRRPAELRRDTGEAPRRTGPPRGESRGARARRSSPG